MRGQNQNNSIAAIQSGKLSHFLVKTGGVRSRLIVNICFLLIILFVSTRQCNGYHRRPSLAGWPRLALLQRRTELSQPTA